MTQAQTKAIQEAMTALALARDNTCGSNKASVDATITDALAGLIAICPDCTPPSDPGPGDPPPSSE